MKATTAQPAASAQSQEAAILKALRRGLKLTPLDMLRLFGCLRASGRIFDLRAKGHAIKTDMVTINGKRLAQYSL